MNWSSSLTGRSSLPPPRDERSDRDELGEVSGVLVSKEWADDERSQSGDSRREYIFVDRGLNAKEKIVLDSNKEKMNERELNIPR